MIPDNVEVNQKSGKVVDEDIKYLDLDDYYDHLKPID